MPEDDKNKNQPEVNPEVDPAMGPNGDPLDEISDEETLRNIIIKTPSFDVKHLGTLSGKSADELRAEAKKFRSISQRMSKTPPETRPAAEMPTDVVRRSDLEKVATREAKEIVGPEVVAVWDELLKIPLGGFDPLDKNSIASNLKERFTVYQARTRKEDKPDTSHLRTTTAPQGTGGEAPQDKISKINAPKKPEDWYPKPAN